MQAERLKKLKEFYEEDPFDPFNLYSLTLAHEKFDLNESKVGYLKLLHDFPQYLPSYFMAAQFLQDFESEEFIISLYNKGILLAIEQKNKKTEDELRRALKSFEDEMML